MNKLKSTANILLRNWRTLFEFELIYKILSMVVFGPLFLGAFNMIMKMSGYGYLTLDNVMEFAMHPLTILLLLLLIIIVALFALFDICTIITVLDYSYHNKKIDTMHAIKISWGKALRVFKKKNILIFVLLLLILPVLNLNTASSFLSAIAIPEFIMEFILQNKVLLSLLIVLFCILEWFALSWIFSFHYFTLEGCNFKEARKKSVNLIRKRRLKTFVTILATEMAFFLIYVILLLLGFGVVFFLDKIVFLQGIINTIGYTGLFVSLFIVVSLTGPICYACISVLFYWGKEQRQERIFFEENENRFTNVDKWFGRGKNLILILLAITCIGCSFGIANGWFNPNIEYVRTMEVSAHRGASTAYPENTMSAFEGAKKLGADWIELDVQQSKDGQIFVMHDTNFKRVCGVDANTWELTYDEISKLDAGSFFSEEFRGEQVPLLETVIAFAKENDIKLNIELKPTGHETDFEKSVVDIIREYDFYDECVVTSMNYEVMENAKKCDSKITTVYVMTLAYGNITELTSADDFSVEESNVTHKLLKKVHGNGSHLYVWTVNSAEKINKMIDMGVDNIITDDVSLALECVEQSKNSNIINEYLKFLDKSFG